MVSCRFSDGIGLEHFILPGATDNNALSPPAKDCVETNCEDGKRPSAAATCAGVSADRIPAPWLGTTAAIRAEGSLEFQFWLDLGRKIKVAAQGSVEDAAPGVMMLDVETAYDPGGSGEFPSDYTPGLVKYVQWALPAILGSGSQEARRSYHH